MGDMKSVDSAIKGVTPGTTMLQRAFSSLGGVISDITSGVLRVLEYTLGNLLAGAIRAVVDQIQELISSAIEAGSEFQALELRLNTLNFNTLIESGMEYNKAQQQAIDLTKEQLTWLQKLAVTTPYDAADIANVYTLARSYGFADINARNLTNDITNFASGMGLGATEIQRIIINLGQMNQLGKVTQRELNDLARGSFVPVNDVLKIMQEQTGLAGKEFEAFLKTTEGVTAFGVAFSTLVEQRFTGSAEKMARTFKAATDNMKDLVKSVVGMNIVKPVLDVIGTKIAEFMDQVAQPARWDAITASAARIGSAFSRIVSSILNLGPNAGTFADQLVSGLNRVADWLDAHEEDIVAWARNAAAWINDTLIPAIASLVGWFMNDEFGNLSMWFWSDFIPAIKQAAEWIGNVLVPFVRDDLVPLFNSLLPLGGAIVQVLFALTGTKPDQSLSDWIHNILIPDIERLTKWISDNKDMIAFWVKAFLVLQVILTVASWIGGLVAGIVGLIFTVVTIISTIAGLVAMFSALAVPIALVIAMVISLFGWFVVFKVIIAQVTALISTLAQGFNNLVVNLQNTLTNIQTAVTNRDWFGLGVAIIQGMANGVGYMMGTLVGAVVNVVKAGYNAAASVLHAHSPSKLFEDLGRFTMEGMALGIQSSAGMAVDAMQRAVGNMTMPALAAPALAYSAMAAPSVTNSHSTTNNYNLNVNTSANKEPIIQDFNMLSSMAGV